MKIKSHLSKRLIVLVAATLLASGLFTACRPAPAVTVPDINDVVATGMAGTQHTWALSTIVSATQAALAGQAHTPGPPDDKPAGNTASTPLPAPAVSDDPCNASEPGVRAYQDERDGYCLLYPENFFVNKPAAGVVEFMGPALDKSSQPLRAYINITQKEPVNGRTLDEIALSVWKGSRGAYHLENIKLGGLDALVAEDLQIGEADWKMKQVLFIHSGTVYLISLSPVDSTPPFDSALPDVQRFWDLAIPSFTFQ